MNDIFVKSKISTKGQIVIPKVVRDEYELKDGDELLWRSTSKKSDRNGTQLTIKVDLMRK